MRIRRRPTILQHDSETALSLRLKTGDEKAFEEIYFRYFTHLHSIGVKFLKSPDLADDAVQDVFLKLWDNRHTLNEAYSIKSFLSVTMKNHVLNIIRDNHAAIWEYLYNDSAELVGEDSTSNTYQLQEYRSILEQGLKKLPPQREKIFRLRVFNGLNNEQIAQQLAISVNTVKFQFSQATKFIKDYLSKHADLESALLSLCILFIF
ncbi:RNA polymerase sigma-70 factor [Spirosoma daeguense]